MILLDRWRNGILKARSILSGEHEEPFILSQIGNIKASHIQELAWLIVSNISTIIIGFLLIKVIAKIGPIEYGKYALVLSIIPLTNALIYAPIEQFSQRYYYDYSNKAATSYFIAGIIRITKNINFILVAILLTSMILLKFITKMDYSTLFFIIISFAYILVFTTAVPFQSLLNTMRRRKLVAFFTISEKAAQLLILIVLSQVMDLNAFAVLTVFAVLGSIFLAGRLKCVKTAAMDGWQEEALSGSGLPPDILRLLVSFGLPIMAFGILAWLQNNSERWVLQFTLGLESVGIYAFMYMICQTILLAVHNPFANFIAPITWEKFADLHDKVKVARGLKLIRYTARFVILETIFIGILLYFFSSWLVLLLGGQRFGSFSPLLPVIFIGVGLFFLGQTLISVGFALNKMTSYTFAKVAGATLSLTFYCLGAYWAGIRGVAWAAVMANIFYVGLVLAANRKILKSCLLSPCLTGAAHD